jgi:nitrogen fixation/metabolism regulation signal transduction histidine kinase
MPFNRFRTRKENRICNGKKKNNVLIIVEDNGIGIKTEDISRIFEFTTKNSGMGLGLGIIKTSLKIIKEQLPLKQNMEREHGLLSLPIINS